MIAVYVSFLLSIHVCILFLYIDLITPGTLIVLLYSSIMILILIALGRELLVERSFEENFLSEITHDLKEAACTSSPRDSKHSRPNLYIKRWKNKHLDRPAEYPLDRIAYLTAKYTPCATNCCFLLKNSQLKQLVLKPDSGRHGRLLDEPHPSKMVNEFFDIYICRRSTFYTERNAICKCLKQCTRPGKKLKFKEICGQGLIDSSPDSSCIDEDEGAQPSCDDYSPSNETDRAAGVRGVWRKVSRAFSR